MIKGTEAMKVKKEVINSPTVLCKEEKALKKKAKYVRTVVEKDQDNRKKQKY